MEAVPPEIERAAHALALDVATTEVVRAFEASGLRCVLLKGPAVIHWLYADEPGAREYGDIDVLVQPSRFASAEGILERLGFEHKHGGYRADLQDWTHQAEWERPAALPVFVDLHRGFHGVADREAFWAVVDAHPSAVEVAGHVVRIPDEAGCAMVVALHDSSTGRSERSAEDLRRAITTLGDDTWREAARRAASAGALPSLVLGLSFHEAGRHLVERLGLPADLPPEVATRSLVAVGVDANQANRAAALQHRLGSAGGWRARVAVMRDIMFPPAEFFTDSRRLAQRGRSALLISRAAYPFGLAARAPRILWLVFRGRRRARRTRPRTDD